MKYKLTTQDMTTHNGHKWEIGVKQTISKPGCTLCSDQVFHFYDGPELAVLLNPIHADIKNPRLFSCKVRTVAHDGLKGGSKSMTLIEEMPLPAITTEQRVAFAIRCAMKVYTEPTWLKWAQDWLSGADRSTDAARTAAAAAAWAAAWAATDAAWAATDAATDAARAAARAAAWAATEKRIDFNKIAKGVTHVPI